MMLQIGHRESHDVDILLSDPQLLPFLDPKLHDFEFEIRPSDYGGDGTGFLKLAFEGIGEVDFIVAHAVTDTPTTRQTIEDEDVDLETVAEIIAKKFTTAAQPSSRATFLTLQRRLAAIAIPLSER